MQKNKGEVVSVTPPFLLFCLCNQSIAFVFFDAEQQPENPPQGLGAAQYDDLHEYTSLSNIMLRAWVLRIDRTISRPEISSEAPG